MIKSIHLCALVLVIFVFMDAAKQNDYQMTHMLMRFLKEKEIPSGGKLFEPFTIEKSQSRQANHKKHKNKLMRF
jgi:hypothetical protein